MTIKVYDYRNKANEIYVPDDKTISVIFVCVLNGDEVTQRMEDCPSTYIR